MIQDVIIHFMDITIATQAIMTWLEHYGSIALFGFLLLGIVAFPIPEETLMVIAGTLIHKGKLAVLPTLLAAYLGSMCGITISYLLGRMTDKYFLKKYGYLIGLSQSRLEAVHGWIHRFGKLTILFGYFIPGLRHFTGFAVGAAELEYAGFAPFAYGGAIIWASTFLAIGYFLGKGLTLPLDEIKYITSCILALCIVLYFLYLLWQIISRKK